VMPSNRVKTLWALVALATGGLAFDAAAAGKPLKVYILAGQSNMQGSAHQRTFAAIGDDPKTAPLLKEILDSSGDPVVCDNAWITYLTGGRGGDTVLHGKVKVGYGFDRERIGPEYGFGITIDKALDGPVLIIKTAWGGKSLAVDFRPPSAGPYVPSDRERERGNIPPKEKVGHCYRAMVRFVRETLRDAESIRKVVPGYDAKQGYETAGFVWFQGWNDMCNRHHIAQYTENMIHFISDVRKELDAPTLPFIVGILGVYGTDPDSRKFDKGLPVTAFRNAQFEEFLLDYQLPILELFGRIAYGCCETLDTKLDALARIPNMTKVLSGPRSDPAGYPGKLGSRCVISWRPVASIIAAQCFDAEAQRRQIREGLEKLKGCQVEVHMHEPMTVQGDVSRISRWAKIAREEAERVA